MKKAHAYIQIILNIIHSPGQRVSEQELAESLQKPYSTLKRYLSELKNIILENGSSPIIQESISGINYYTLNKSLFKYFYPEHLETAFYFEAYHKIGNLLQSSNFKEDVTNLKEEVFNLNGKSEEFSRKFFYKSSTQSTNTSLEFQAIIVQSLIENKKIKLLYSDKEYCIEPLCLTQYRDSLYLVAYNELKEIRRFKFNRIQAIELTSTTFKYPTAKNWNPETFFKNSSGIITGDIKSVTVNVYGLSRIHIKEREFFNKQLQVSNSLYDTYKLNYTNDDEFLGQLFVYAQDIQILDSDELREKLVTKAQEAIKKNSFNNAA